MQAEEMVLQRPAPLRRRNQVVQTVGAVKRSGQRRGDVLAHAERHCASQDERLTPIRRDLLQVLSSAEAPLGAYDIAGRLSELQQRRATPVAAYRGLEFLARVGLVTRLESLNAFILCAHPDHPHDCVFLLCGTCGEVKEALDDRLSDLLEQRAKKAGFATKRRVIEILGTCESCQPDEAAAREAGR